MIFQIIITKQQEINLCQKSKRRNFLTWHAIKILFNFVFWLSSQSVCHSVNIYEFQILYLMGITNIAHKHFLLAIW